MKKKPIDYKIPPILVESSVVRESAVLEPPQEIGAFAAKTHLSSLLEKVAGGESFYITKHGKRIAELKPVAPLSARPIAGLWEGRIWMADDFDAPLDDFKEYME